MNGSIFFNDKGLELLDLLIKRKQKKIRLLDRSIAELRATLESSKERPEFIALSKQLNRDMEQRQKLT